MCDESPGHAIDPGQAGQRLVEQHRQGAEVAARQALVDRQQLGIDEMEVVEQPLRRRADVVARRDLVTDHRVGLPQHADVVLQARKEGRVEHARPLGAMGRAEAAPMLGEAYRPEDLGPYRLSQHPGRRIQKSSKRLRHLRQQALQDPSRHELQHQPGDADHRCCHRRRADQPALNQALQLTHAAMHGHPARAIAIAQRQMLTQGRQLCRRRVSGFPVARRAPH